MVGLGLRKEAPKVGVVTRTRARRGGSADGYDASIMHREVAATLATWTVTVDASDEELGRRLRVAQHDVRACLLTSRCPLVDPRPSAGRPSRFCDNAIVARRRLAVAVPLETLERYRDMARELRRRLKECAGSELRKPRTRARYYKRNESPASDVKSVELDPRAHRCGAQVETGKRIARAADGALVRVAGGLYGCARHRRPLRDAAYVELDILYAGGAGGIAVGVAPESQCIDKMVGSIPGSLALHSAAQLVVNGQWMDAPCEAQFGTGDVVGVRTAIDGNHVRLTYTVNGVHVADVSNVVDVASVHLVVSLLRPGSRVAVRCCAHDWHYAGDGALSLCQSSADRADQHWSAVLTP